MCVYIYIYICKEHCGPLFRRRDKQPETFQRWLRAFTPTSKHKAPPRLRPRRTDRLRIYDLSRLSIETSGILGRKTALDAPCRPATGKHGWSKHGSIKSLFEFNVFC